MSKVNRPFKAHCPKTSGINDSRSKLWKTVSLKQEGWIYDSDYFSGLHTDVNCKLPSHHKTCTITALHQAYLNYCMIA